jgi:hypothetical protein
MSHFRKFFQSAVPNQDPIKDGHSKNDYTYQLIEHIEIEELRKLLGGLKSKELQFVAEQLHIRPMPVNGITTYMAELVQSTSLKLFKSGSIEGLCEVISRPLSKRTREVLGESFEDPSSKSISGLTQVLIDEFGSLKTKVYYAGSIDGQAKATPFLLKELAQRPELRIDLFLHDETPTEEQTPRPAPNTELKQSRKVRRASKKESRSEQRRQVVLTRKADKKRIADQQEKLKNNVTVIASPIQVPEASIEIAKLEHRHLTRYVKAQTTHDLVGQVFWGFISYGKDDPELGKRRPCVIVAVAPKYFIVRPVFSRASRYAGLWRAVLIENWHEAGLDHESLVGHDTQKISKDKIVSRIGSLTTHDWNRICRGEVNTKS